MEEQEAMALTRAYTTLRDELHHLALQELPGHVPEDCFTAERDWCGQAGRSAGGRMKYGIIARKF